MITRIRVTVLVLALLATLCAFFRLRVWDSYASRYAPEAGATAEVSWKRRAYTYSVSVKPFSVRIRFLWSVDLDVRDRGDRVLEELISRYHHTPTAITHP